MNPTTRRHASLGLALLLVIAGTVWGVLSAFVGHFSTYDVVYADVPASGTGISPGSVVIFRDITVGMVGSLGRELPNGLIRVELHMNPDDLSSIPSGVKADVEIATVFGTQGINLVPPTTAVPGHLVADTTIVPVGRSSTTSLQGDATDLDNLLNALHPAALDQTLTAVAAALKDQGPQLGSTIANVATYLNEMLPQLPTIINDFEKLGPVTTELSQAAPSIISTLAHGSITAATITNEAAPFRQLLANGAPTANELSGLLTQSQSAFDDLVANSAPLLGDVASNPNFVAQTLNGFDNWSKAFAAAESHGPFLSFAGSLDIEGSAQAVLAALGLPGSNTLVEQGLGPENFNPPTYTSAQCPMYVGESGPNCPKSAAKMTAASANAASVPLVITPTEERAAVAIATGLNKGQQPPSAAVTALLLEPLLADLTGAR